MTKWVVPLSQRLRVDAQPAGLSVRANAVSLAITAVLQRNGARVTRVSDEMAMIDAIQAVLVAGPQNDALSVADAFVMLAQMMQADSLTMSDSFTVKTLLDFDYYARPGELRPGASRLGAARTAATGSFLNINIADTLGVADAVDLSAISFAQDDTMALADAVSALGTIPIIDDGMSSADEAFSSSEDVGPQTDDIIAMSDAVTMLALQDVADGAALADAFDPSGDLGVADSIAAADAIDPLGTLFAADGIAASDAFTVDGAMTQADGVAVVDATTAGGSMAQADAMTVTDAQIQLGTAMVADGIAAVDSTSYTSSGGSTSTMVYLLHLNEVADGVRPTAWVNSVSGGPAFLNKGHLGETGAQSSIGSAEPFGTGAFTQGNNGALCAITSATAYTFAADLTLQGFVAAPMEGNRFIAQFSTDGTDGGDVRIQLIGIDEGGGLFSFLCYAQRTAAEGGFEAFRTGAIAPMTVAGVSGYHWAFQREPTTNLLTLRSNEQLRATSSQSLAGPLTGYIDAFGAYEQVSGACGGMYGVRVSELRGDNVALYTGATYTVPPGRFTT